MPLPRASLRSFLSTAKSALESTLKQIASSPPAPPITLVIGNESADLDSVISALLLAYLKTYTSPAPSTITTTTPTPPRIYIPLSNLPHADLSLRPELRPLLQHAHLLPSDLLTLSSLPPPSQISTLLSPTSTSLLLVDHNALTGPLSKIYTRSVVGCIDHHDDEHAVPRDTGDEPRIVQKCGSCTSLVVEEYREAWVRLSSSGQLSENESESERQKGVKWDAELARLALGPVLVDTACLRSKEKTTEVDVQAVEFLEGLVRRKEGEGYDREVFFGEMERAKEDVGGLEMRDILRKDYKEWGVGEAGKEGVKMGISSVVKDLAFLVGKAGGEEGFLDEAGRFARDSELAVWAVMTTSNHEGVFRRELFVWGLDGGGVDAVKRFEVEAKEKLGLQVWGDGRLDKEGEGGDKGGWRRAWNQERTENSRKQVAPLLRKAMEGGM